MIEKKIVFWDWLGTLVLNSKDPQLWSNDIADYISYAWALVDEFNKLNFLQVIVTNGMDEEIHPQLKYLPFKNFDLIMTASHFKKKPDTQMFDHALKKFSLNKEEALYIGDSEIDEQTAKATCIDFYKVDAQLDSYLRIAQDYKLIEPFGPTLPLK